MKELLQKYKKPLLSGAVCLLLVLALAAGSWAALSAPRQEPETPQTKSYPGLNIEQIGLRYDQKSQTQDSAAGDGEGEDGQSQQDDAQQEPESPPEEVSKPDQIPVEEPDPDQQEPEDKTDDTTPGDTTDDKADDQPGDGDDGPVDPEQPADDQPQEPQIVTDLRNRNIRQDELENDMFPFMLKVVNGDDDTYLIVRVNGKRVSSADGNFQEKLKLGDNSISYVLKRGGETLGEGHYNIKYQAALADEEEPEKGENPPTIRTNLGSNGATVETTNRNLTLKVWAEDWQGNPLNQDNVIVTMDDKVVRLSTGSGADGLEYDLFLDTGLGGDETEHYVTITAQDADGNSVQSKYTIIYQVRDSGEKIGTATVRLDLSVLGLGVIDTVMDCDIFQDQPASYVLMEALEYLGYEASFTGTLDSNFYLARISRASAFNGAAVPGELKKLLELDGMTVKAPRPSAARDSLGEFDYTIGSGWMYSINGTTYPGRGLSGYFLSDGDVLTLRFTLAYGKDIGGSTGGGTGSLTRYCGTWIDGVYTPHHTYQDGKCSICGAIDPNHTHSETESVTKAATCTEAGEKTYTCSLCGESHTETIPATGHHYDENGICTGCGQSDPDAKPEPDPDPEPEPTPDPEPEPGGEETQNDEAA